MLELKSIHIKKAPRGNMLLWYHSYICPKYSAQTYENENYDHQNDFEFCHHNE